MWSFIHHCCLVNYLLVLPLQVHRLQAKSQSNAKAQRVNQYPSWAHSQIHWESRRVGFLCSALKHIIWSAATGAHPPPPPTPQDPPLEGELLRTCLYGQPPPALGRGPQEPALQGFPVCSPETCHVYRQSGKRAKLRPPEPLHFSNNQTGSYLRDLTYSCYKTTAEEVRYREGYSSRHWCYSNTISLLTVDDDTGWWKWKH